MVITKYGLTLRLMTSADLETVRQWRNLSRVRGHMHFQKELSSADQAKWFQSLDSDKNVYWIFSINGLDLGLVHIKDINNGVGEPGIFTGLEAYLGTPTPALAILVMMDVGFEILKLERLRAKIKVSNSHNLWTNLKFGYQPESVELNDGFEYYTVTESRFKQHTSVLRPALEKLNGGETVIQISENTSGILSEAIRKIPRTDSSKTLVL